MWVVAVENAFNGIQLFGPFLDRDEAVKWADASGENDWEVVKVTSKD